MPLSHDNIDANNSLEQHDDSAESTSPRVIHGKINSKIFSQTPTPDDDERTYRICNSRSGKSGLRSKYMLEGIYIELLRLKDENEQLRKIVQEHIKPIHIAIEILREVEEPVNDIFLESSILLDDLIEFEEEDDVVIAADHSKSEKTMHSSSVLKKQNEFIKSKGEGSNSNYTERIKVDSSVYEEGDMKMLSNALNGDFAF